MNINSMTPFSSLNDLTSLIDQPTCYKNPDKVTCIDLILMNCPNYFQKNNAFETALSDFHMMVSTELKMGFQKPKFHIVAHRGLIMKSFDQTFKVLPQKKIWNALKKLFLAFLTSMRLLKESISLLMRLPLCQKSYIKLSWRDPG